MKHYLQPALLAPPPALEITDEEYLLLKQSATILNTALSIEEIYDLLVGNYLEIETSALSISAAAVARQLTEYQELFELKAEMNRRAVNFLTTARLFVDQLRQKVKACGGDAEATKSSFSKEYDAFFEYRFMEQLRNHVQHSGSAIHGFRFEVKWVPPSRVRRENAFEVFVQKKFLQLDQSFKKEVLQECPDEVEFLNAARCYLESLSKVHASARLGLADVIEEARASIKAAIEKYVKFAGASALGLTAYSGSSDSSDAAFPVFLDWDDVRIKLSRRNRILTNLSKNVISSVRS